MYIFVYVDGFYFFEMVYAAEVFLNKDILEQPHARQNAGAMGIASTILSGEVLIHTLKNHKLL